MFNRGGKELIISLQGTCKKTLFIRFVIVFNREGYSPEFFREMWVKHRIVCLSYHKHQGGDWPVDAGNPEAVGIRPPDLDYRYRIQAANGTSGTPHVRQMVPGELSGIYDGTLCN